jgi:aldose 1-epimerase
MLLSMNNLSDPRAPQHATEATDFGTLPDGSPVQLFTVASGGLRASFSDYGARLVSLHAPDRTGTLAGVVLGYDALPLYLQDNTYSGAIVGRFGNRIAAGKFSLDGTLHQVPLNDKTNALHGGPVGFDQRVWSATPTDSGVEMTLVSPGGDQGFPGTLRLTVRYTLSDHSLRIDYAATTDATTIVNVTNHAYFNLAGDTSASILDHHILIPAEHYTPVDSTLIPTGELAPVQSTPFDFRTSTRIGDRIDQPDLQLQRAGGYDHNWVFGDPSTLKLAARLTDPASGRVMAVETTEPGMQFYSGNFIDGSMPNRAGGFYLRRAGLCLETQNYPDAPNQSHFPSCVLRPGETLRSSTIFTFSTDAPA